MNKNVHELIFSNAFLVSRFQTSGVARHNLLHNFLDIRRNGFGTRANSQRQSSDLEHDRVVHHLQLNVCLFTEIWKDGKVLRKKCEFRSR